MLYIRHFYSRPQRAVILSLLVLLLGLILLSNFHNRTAGVNATAMLPPMPVPTCAPTPANMTAWFPGDGNANNLANPGNNGALQGGATATGVGMVGQGFNLDGIDDYVAVSNNAALNFGIGDFSIDAWIKTSASGLQVIVDKRVESPANVFTGYALFVTNGQLGVQLADGVATNFIAVTNVATGTFHHVAATVTRNSATGGKLYVDGAQVLMFDPTARSGSLTNVAELRIGGHSINYPSFSFNGCIDEVELFNRALTSVEVSGIFNAGSAGKCKGASSCAPAPAGLVSWYKGENNANDAVGSNNGTLQNGTTFAAGEVGQAFSLDGVDDYVDLGPGASSSFNLDKMTLDAWVFINPATNVGERRVISKDNFGLAGTRKLFTLKSSAPFIAGNNGRAAFAVLIGAAIDSIEAPSALTAGWHLLAGVRDTSTNRFELYVDGAMVASKIPTVVGPIDSAVNTVLGRVSPTQASEHFAGLIDEAEIFNQAVSGASILSIFNAGSAGKCPVTTCFSLPFPPVSWYPGDGNANDIAGSNNGTLVNGTTFAAGEVLQAFSLDGVDDYVDLGSGFNLDKLSLDAWVFINPATNVGERRVISKDNTGLIGTRKLFALKSSAPFIAGNNGRAAFVVLIGAGIDSIEAPSALTAGWHLLAGVRDTSTNRFELYVDGALVASKVPTVVGPIDSAVNTVLGRVSPSQASEHFAGLIDEAEIFNQPLSQLTIQSIFNAGSLGKCKPVNPPNTADLTITKDDGVTNPLPGSTITYIITVVNNGPANVTGALVNDTFPANISGVNWICTPSSGATCPSPFGSGNITNQSVNLNVGSSVVFTASGTVINTPISNTATVTAPAGITDPNLSNNSATDNDPPIAPPGSVDLSLSPSFCASVMRGKTSAIQLKITNKGPATATGVMTSTSLPPGIDLCSTSVNGGGSCTSTVNFLGQTIIQCDLQTMANGTSKTVQINIRPRCNASSPLTTMNSVWSNEFEFVPRDNRLGTNSAVTGTCAVPSACTVPSGVCQ